MSLGAGHRNLGGCDPSRITRHRFCASICTAKNSTERSCDLEIFAAAQNCLARILSLREISHRLAFERRKIFKLHVALKFYAYEI